MRVNPFVLLGLSIIALTSATFANADTGLAQRCDGVTAATQASACTGSRTWVHPASGDAVLSYPSVPADSTTIAWGDANLQFRPWVSIPGTYGVQTCAKDIAAANVTIPVGGTDPCAPGADAAAKVFVAASSVVTAVVAPPVALANGIAHLSWIATTANADGTPLTDLTGYNVYQGNSPTTLTKVTATPVPAGTTSYTITGLGVGTWYFAITAISASEGEGAWTLSNSVVVNKVVVPSKPGAPGSVTVTVTVSAP